MTNNTDHDRLFKELISTFFVEFIDVTEGERYESDLVAQVKFREKESFF
jgi:hypothetical protein